MYPALHQYNNWFKDGPPSTTLAQDYSNIGSMCGVFWDVYDSFHDIRGRVETRNVTQQDAWLILHLYNYILWLSAWNM